MRIKLEIELRRPARRSVGLLLGLLLLCVPAVALASHQFSDVPPGHPFHDDIDWLADYGITTGFGDGTFRPSEPVTRQAMAAFMHRLSNEFEVVSRTVDPPPNDYFESFAACPDDKRAIAGGGNAGVNNLLMRDSWTSGISWFVRWESDNNATLDPSDLTVYALCAPRL